MLMCTSHDSTAAPIALDGEFAVEQRQHDAVVGRCTERSTTAMSPGKSPAPIMLSPASRTANVAAGLTTSSSLKSSGPSR
jgi:hypothetical protein